MEKQVNQNTQSIAETAEEQKEILLKLQKLITNDTLKIKKVTVVYVAVDD